MFLGLQEFKECIERYAPQFVGQAQQDAQEFMAYLLDGLHEDVNRAQRSSASNPDSSGLTLHSIIASCVLTRSFSSIR